MVEGRTQLPFFGATAKELQYVISPSKAYRVRFIHPFQCRNTPPHSHLLN